LLKEIGGWNEAIRSRSHTELFFRICSRFPITGVSHPVYRVSTDTHQGLTDDPELRQASYTYLLESYAELLEDPSRRKYFERNHLINMGRSASGYSIISLIRLFLQRL
jgi:hypothetical protein